MMRSFHVGAQKRYTQSPLLFDFSPRSSILKNISAVKSPFDTRFALSSNESCPEAEAFSAFAAKCRAAVFTVPSAAQTFARTVAPGTSSEVVVSPLSVAVTDVGGSLDTWLAIVFDEKSRYSAVSAPAFGEIAYCRRKTSSPSNVSESRTSSIEPMNRPPVASGSPPMKSGFSPE